MSHDRSGWTQFRAERDAELREPYGWLTLQGFHWLPADPGQLPGLPGRWSAGSEDATVTAEAADGLRRADGSPLDGTSTKSVPEAGRDPWVTHNGVRVELMRRGGRFCVRLRTETSPEQEAFEAVPTFPFDPAWVLPARFEPFDRPRAVEVATIRPDLRQLVNAVGEVVFDAGGAPQRLVATRMKFGLGVEFHDPTNGDTTPAWRQLRFEEPDSEGSTVLDFNRTILMWFAFTDYATCPSPMEGNEITVPVTAGERG